MARVELPDEPPAGYVQRKGKPGPHDRLRTAVETLATGWGHDDNLRGLAIVATFVDDMIAEEVASLREPMDDGAPERSWTEIGKSLGMSKQAAQQRYGVKSG